MIYHQGALLMRGAELSPSAEQSQHILCADLIQEVTLEVTIIDRRFDSKE